MYFTLATNCRSFAPATRKRTRSRIPQDLPQRSKHTSGAILSNGCGCTGVGRRGPRARKGSTEMAELSEIVEWVKGSTKAEVRLNAGITRVSAMEDADRDAAVFAMDENALKTAIASRAGLILANIKLNHPDRAVTDERVV